MSRAERLLELLQVLRRHRRPVSGQSLAAELGISIRTLYRDIESLQASGAAIDGAPGLGYVLRPGFLLPPLMFSEEEIEALVLGSRWVADRADERLGAAARDALAKIGAVLPARLAAEVEGSGLLVGPGKKPTAGDRDLVAIRQAIRSELKLEITYRDREERETRRRIWPFALGFFDHSQVVAAWCELRQSFRHFRTDRIGALETLQARYPRRRQVLLREWREIQRISPP
jgi:predicted DNA-binding transcriptional regulator YafY